MGCSSPRANTLVRRLLASPYAVHSLLVEEGKLDRIAALVPSATPVYIAPEPLVRAILGYKFHSGVMACGVRPAEVSLTDLKPDGPGPITLLVCPDLNNSSNLGSIIRSAAALGAAGLLLGPECCDPFWRMSIRVSMGAVFRLPIVRTTDLQADLMTLSATILRWRRR